MGNEYARKIYSLCIKQFDIHKIYSKNPKKAYATTINKLKKSHKKFLVWWIFFHWFRSIKIPERAFNKLAAYFAFKISRYRTSQANKITTKITYSKRAINSDSVCCWNLALNSTEFMNLNGKCISWICYISYSIKTIIMKQNKTKQRKWQTWFETKANL